MDNYLSFHIKEATKGEDIAIESCISKERLLHMHGVAELMFKYYDFFDCLYLHQILNLRMLYRQI